MRHANVVNVDEVECVTESKGTRFGYAEHVLANGREIGCTRYQVQPGRAAFPAHFHTAGEEALFVLAGTATMRIGDARVPVRAGDYVAFPPGPQSAHQLVNTGDAPVVYLCLSTSPTVEVVGYMDSKRTGVRAAATVEDAYQGRAWARQIFHEQASAGSYDGEDVGIAAPAGGSR